MSRSGYLFNQESITDDDDHYGTSPSFVGVGTSLREEYVDWINVGTETEVTIDVTNSLNQEVTVVVEGFLGDPLTFEAADLDDDGNWDLVDTMVVAAGGTDQSVVDLSSPTDYNKIRAKVTATVAPTAGASDEVQAINLGDAATANAVTQGQLVDSSLTPSPTDLPHQDFNSLPIGLRGSLVDAFRSSGVAQTGAATDEPFGNPSRPSFKLTFNSHATDRVYYDADITAAIQAALDGLSDFDPGDVTVSRTSATIYSVSFAGGAYEGQDVGPITITSPWGFTPTGVTVTEQGADFLTISWNATRGDSIFSGIPVGT